MFRRTNRLKSRTLPGQPLSSSLRNFSQSQFHLQPSQKRESFFSKIKLNDIRLLFVVFAMSSLAVYSYYSYHETNRKLEFKEKRREERKETMQNVVEGTKKWWVSKKKGKQEENEGKSE